MKQYEAVVEAMRQNGGLATLGYLYQAVLKIPDCHWGTKTPFASIRRIVQQHPQLFFKIKPGLWALTAQRKLVLEKLALNEVSTRSKEFNHSYYQGLLVEIGNLKKRETFVPHQDKNKPFLTGKLADVVTLTTFYSFTYDSLLRRARTIDVSWFNERQMPEAFFEVEHSTGIRNSLDKFLEFQDFRINFVIVADAVRQREFQSKLSSHYFSPIRKAVKFLDYEKLADLHSKISASVSAERELNF